MVRLENTLFDTRKVRFHLPPENDQDPSKPINAWNRYLRYQITSGLDGRLFYWGQITPAMHFGFTNGKDLLSTSSFPSLFDDEGWSTGEMFCQLPSVWLSLNKSVYFSDYEIGKETKVNH